MSKLTDREKAERAASELARLLGRVVTYIAKDGCEVKAMPNGAVFYNVEDWY